MSYESSLKGSAAVSHPTRVASAREKLLTDGNLPDNTVRSVIEASWQRCVTSQVDPLVAKHSLELSSDELMGIRRQHKELISASEIIMREAKELLAESGTIMHLVTPSGMILDYEGDPATLELANNFSLIPGANWNEQAAGTNAIGTALNIGAPVQVHAFEHFCENISRWTCSAAVIRDPFEKRLLGALNISGLKNTLHDYCLALAISGARRIEGQFAQLKMAQRDLLLGSTIDHFTNSGNDGVLLFDMDGKLVRANTMADKVLAARGIKINLTPYNPILTLNSEGVFTPESERALNQIDSNWVQPVIHQGEQIGYLAIIPLPARQSQRATNPVTNVPPPSRSTGFFRLVGQSAPFLKAVQQAKRIAKAPIPVLLQGETGVGKELFARAMHEEGPSQTGEFVALNCGGLSRDLLAGELFGHVEGAFTGARRGGMIGKIEAANGGTLFLDEIGEMPLDLQPMFLRVLQESEICRVGETRPRKVNFRLIAATNRDLAQEVAEGRFRMDLYYRISSMTLTVPPLRERKGDVSLLAQNIFAHLLEQYSGDQKRLSKKVLELLERHNWPGNIRELGNLITAAFFLSDREELTPDDLPKDFLAAHSSTLEDDDANPLDLAEKEVIIRAIREQGGNLTQVAKQLNIAKSTLYIKLKKYGIERP
ncbi:sigma-54-dependent Fis family transcriptional regulator [Porticoccus litoralis]|uniref:Sigma-54-dependent Fis family transcriptional regulator n=1 Tax=Porticoccus litoralis TaxID=434086 RepID=A0AAW8B212_9GAMM|nr:sigma-54-dependent Fis family transcriptional regulator [Porticoccus litoralis]MDP1520671.1 sigma-54-dependent Fis family transcriptional regulator [Porticoccus litoralis]